MNLITVSSSSLNNVNISYVLTFSVNNKTFRWLIKPRFSEEKKYLTTNGTE